MSRPPRSELFLASRRRFLATAVGLGAAPGCSPSLERSDPVSVAESFLDRYLVDVDQGAAMELASGRAREQLEQELEAVREIRAQGASTRRGGDDELSFVLRDREEATVGRVLLMYDVLMGEDSSRRIVVNMSETSDLWSVTNYQFHAGE